MKVLVIIPTSNEAYNVSAIIKAVLAQDPDIEVLIVDDNSPDGTSKIVEEMKSPKIHLHPKYYPKYKQHININK